MLRVASPSQEQPTWSHNDYEQSWWLQSGYEVSGERSNQEGFDINNVVIT